MKDLIKYGLPFVVILVIPPIVANIIGFRLGGEGVAVLTTITASYYFYLDNPHSAYKKGVIAALIAWVIAFLLSAEFLQGNLLPALFSGILAFLYFLRFRAREDTHFVDYLKLAGILALVPATYIPVAIPFICTFLAYIFLLDRLTIRKTMNKTTQILVFSLMALFCLSFLVYGFIKADEADKARIAADAQRLEAERLRDEAVNQVNEARLAKEKAEIEARQTALALAEAKDQAERANKLEQALAKCQSK